MALIDAQFVNEDLEDKLGKTQANKLKVSNASKIKREQLDFTTQKLQGNLLSENESPLHDADTFNGQRIGGIEGFGFDALEVSGAKFSEKDFKDKLKSSKGQRNAERSLIRHSQLVADNLGIDIEDVTPEMIFEQGKLTTDKARDILLERNTNVFEDDDRNLDGSLKEGPRQILVDKANVGIDQFGRPLIQLRNPVTGKSLEKELNNPQDNAGFNTRFNKTGREEFFADRLNTQKLQQSKSNIKFSQEEIENGNRLANLGLIAEDTAKSIGGSVKKLVTTNSTQKEFSPEDVKVLQSLGQKKARLKVLQDLVDSSKGEERLKHIQKLNSVPEFTEKELEFDKPKKIYSPSKDGASFIERSALDEYIEANRQTNKRQDIDEQVAVSKEGNTYENVRGAEVFGARNEKAAEHFQKLKKSVGDDRLLDSAVDGFNMAKEFTGGIVDAIGDNPQVVGTFFAESAPYMALAATGIGILGIANDHYQSSVETFQKDNGRLPSNSEGARIATFSLGAAYLERLGIKGMGLLPKVKRDKLAEKLKKIATDQASGKITKGAARLKAEIAMKIAKGSLAKKAAKPQLSKALKAGGAITGNFLKGVLSESATEIGEDALKSIGEKGDTSGLDAKSLLDSGSGGALGGTGPSGATVAFSTAKELLKPVAKGTNKVAKKVQEKKAKFAANKQESADDAIEILATKPEDITADPEAATKAVLGAFATAKDKAPALAAIQRVQEVILGNIASTEAAADLAKEQGNEAEAIELSKKATDLEAQLTSTIQRFKAVKQSASRKRTTNLIPFIQERTEENPITEAESNDIIGQISSGRISGSEDLTKLTFAVKGNSNTPKQLVEVVEAANESAKAQEKLAKSKDQVSNEVLGAGVNEKGKFGLLKHEAAIKSAIDSGDIELADKAVAKLENFLASQLDKISKITQLKEGETILELKEGESAKNKFDFKNISDGQTRGFIKSSLLPEVEAIRETLNLTKKLKEIKFKDDSGKKESSIAGLTFALSQPSRVTNKDADTAVSDIAGFTFAPDDGKENVIINGTNKAESTTEKVVPKEATKVEEPTTGNKTIAIAINQLPKVVSSNVREGKENQEILARRTKGGEIEVSDNQELWKQKFDDKAWNDSVLLGEPSNQDRAKPINKGTFTTLAVFKRFVILHEHGHSLIKRNKTETTGEYETRINNYALDQLGLRDIAYKEETAATPEVTPVISQVSPNDGTTQEEFKEVAGSVDIAKLEAHLAAIETETLESIDEEVEVAETAPVTLSSLMDDAISIAEGIDGIDVTKDIEGLNNFKTTINKEGNAITVHNGKKIRQLIRNLNDKIRKVAVSKIANTLGVSTIQGRTVEVLRKLPFTDKAKFDARDATINAIIEANTEEAAIELSYAFYTENGFPTAIQTSVDGRLDPHRAIEQSKDGIITKNVESLGNLLKLAKKTPVSLFGLVPDLINGLKNTKVGKQLTVNLTNTEKSNLNNYIGLIEAINDSYVKAFNNQTTNKDNQESGKSTKHFKQDLAEDPLLLFKDADGNLPANLISASSAVALNWLYTQGTGTDLNVEDDINGILLRDTGTTVTTEAFNLLSRAGVPLAALEAQLGKLILQQANLAVLKEGVEGTFKDRLEANVGRMAIIALVRSNVAEINKIDGKDFNTLLESTEILEGSENRSRSFVRIKSSDAITSIIEKITEPEYTSMLSKLFNIYDRSTGPLTEPNKKVDDKLGRTHNKVSPSRLKDIAFAEQQEWEVKENVDNLMKRMSDDNIYKMDGFDTNPEASIEEKRESIKSKNASITRAFEHLRNFTSKHEKGAPFFFKYFVTGFNRTMMKSNTVNPESNKMHRHSVGLKEWNVTVNKDNLIQFQLAVAESFGLSVDKQTNESTIKQFFNEIINQEGEVVDPVVAEAVVAIQSEGKLNKKQQDAIVEAISKGGEQYHTMDGLIALSEYKAAIDAGINGEFEFTTNITRETDGITNGIIIGSILMAMDVDHAKGLAVKGGIHFDTKYQTHSEYQEQPDTRDNYEEVTVLTHGNLQVIKQTASNSVFDKNVPDDQIPRLNKIDKLYGQDLVEKLVSLERISSEFIKFDINGVVEKVLKAGRDFSKNPLMIVAYGASIGRIVGEMVDDAIEGSLIKMNDLNGKTDPRSVAELKQLVADLNSITGSNITIPTDRTFTFDKWQKVKYSRYMRAYYGDALGDALNVHLGPFLVARDHMLNATRVMSEVFNTLYTKRVAELTATNKGLPISTAAKTEVVMELRARGLMPSYKHATSESEINEDSLDITKTERVYLPKEMGGVSKTKTKIPFPINKIGLDGSKTPAEQDSLSSAMYTTEPTGEVGVAAFIAGIISVDGNINSLLMGQNAMLNLFDAAINNLNDATGNTQMANKAFKDIVFNWSMADSVQASLDVFMEAIDLELTPEELAELNKKLIKDPNNKPNPDSKAPKVKTLSDPFTGEAYLDLNDMHKDFKSAVETIGENRETLKADLVSVENYKDDGAKSLNEDHVVIESEKGVSKAVDNLKVETKADDKRAKDFNEFILGKTRNKNGKTINQNKLNAEEKIYYLENKAAIDSLLGSGIQGSVDLNGFGINDITSLDYEFKELLTRDTAKLLFEKFGLSTHVIETIGHTKQLLKVLNELLNPVLDSVDNVITLNKTDKIGVPRNVGGITEDATQIFMLSATGISKNSTDMSEQEVLIHELTHAFWKKAIDGNPFIRRQVTRLFNAAEKHFESMDKPYEIFLEDGKDHTDAEVQAAKDRYDYIFKSKEGYLHEFAVFGLTNEKMIAALGNVADIKIPNRKPESFLDSLKDVFKDVVEWVQGLLNKSVKQGTVDKSLWELASNVHSIQKASKAKVTRTDSAINKLNSKAISAISDYIVKPYIDHVETAIEANKTRPSGNKLKRLVRETIAVPYLIGTGGYNGAVSDLLYNLDFTTDNVIHKWVKEVGGPKLTELSWHTLLRKSKHVIDSARKRMIDTNTAQIRDMFLDPKSITEDNWIQLNATILKTDLSVLVDGVRTMEQLIELMNSDAAVAKEITRINKRLNIISSKNARYYKKQAESLGHYMAKGIIGLEHQMFNATNIANLSNTGNTVEGNLGEIVTLVDELATLNALKYTDHKSKQETVKVMEIEANSGSETDGITHMLGVHQNFKDNSLERLFENDKAQMMKGFTSEKFGTNTAFKVGTAENEKEFNQEGYVKVGPVKGSDLLKTDELFFYVTHTKPQSDYVSGVSSQTSERSKGTNISSVIAQNKTAYSSVRYNVKNMNAQGRKATQGIFNGSVELDFTKNYLAPITDDKGTITDYRYMMSEETKISQLRKKDLANEVLGRMQGSILDKVESKKINRLVIDQTKEDFDKEFAEDPRRFVLIGPNAKSKKLQEIYAMMPKDMRDYAESIHGSKDFYVKEEMLGLIFGFRKLSITDLLSDAQEKVTGFPMHFRLKNASKHAGIIWEAVVKKAKRNIVILLPQVLIANVISNESLLFMKGIPIKYGITKQAEAIRALNDYQVILDKRDRLQNILDSIKNVPNRAVKQRNVDRLNKALELNPVNELIDEGMFQTIVEDVTVEDTVKDSVTNAIPVLNKFVDSIEDVLSKTKSGSFVKDGYDQLVIAPNTTTGKLLMQATAYSDFVARYTLFKYRTEVQNKAGADVIQEVVDTFINYDVNTSPELQWLNDMGIMMFTKFLFRIQRVIFKLLKAEPARVMMQQVVDKALIDLPDIFESNLVTNNFIQRMNAPFSPDVLDDAMTFNLLNYLPFF